MSGVGVSLNDLGWEVQSVDHIEVDGIYSDVYVGGPNVCRRMIEIFEDFSEIENSFSPAAWTCADYCWSDEGWADVPAHLSPKKYPEWADLEWDPTIVF